MRISVHRIHGTDGSMQAIDHDIVTQHEFTLEVAHMVEGISRMHGHTIFVRLDLMGENDPKYEWPVNLFEVKRRVKALKQEIGTGDEHGDGEGEGDLTLIPEIGTVASLERITRWMWSRLKPDIPELVRMKVYRGVPGTYEGCVYAGPEGAPGPNRRPAAET